MAASLCSSAGTPRTVQAPKQRTVGAGTYLVLGDRLAVYTERWPLVIGLIFMTFVLFLPKGIWGTLIDKLPGATSAGAKR